MNVACPRCKQPTALEEGKFVHHPEGEHVNPCPASYKTPDEVQKALDDPILYFGPGRVSRAIHWQNDMVMVFDVDGNQVEELQGRYSDHLVAAVLVASGPLTKFQWAVWLTGEVTEVNREEW